MEAAIPSQLGKYRVDGLIGEGAMGVVYRGFDTLINRPVAIKTIHAHLLRGAEGAEMRARFLREAQLAARCHHPGIVTVFDFGEHDAHPYLVMEYVEGQDLKSLLQRRGRFSLAEASSMIIQVLEALQFAHQNGVIHRDVKPSNMILTKEGRVRVTDFGIARVDSSDMTQAGMMVGTPSYMSPEQVMGQTLDHRSDLFAVGVVFYELLSGDKPFSRRSTGHATLAGVLNVDPPPLSARLHEIPATIDTLLCNAMAKEPAQRFAEAGLFIRAIRGALGENVGALPQNLEGGDLTRVAPSASAGIDAPTMMSGVQAWDPAVLSDIETRLTPFLGPVTRVLVRKHAATARDRDELLSKLAESIPNGSERTVFLSRCGVDGTRVQRSVTQPTTTDPALVARWSDDELKKAEAALAFYVGPVAKTLVKRAAGSVTSRDQLYARLAEHIPNEKERAAFLQSTKSK